MHLRRQSLALLGSRTFSSAGRLTKNDPHSTRLSLRFRAYPAAMTKHSATADASKTVLLACAVALNDYKRSWDNPVKAASRGFDPSFIETVKFGRARINSLVTMPPAKRDFAYGANKGTGVIGEVATGYTYVVNTRHLLYNH
jgi:hypothetical protein